MEEEAAAAASGMELLFHFPVAEGSEKELRGPLTYSSWPRRSNGSQRHSIIFLRLCALALPERGSSTSGSPALWIVSLSWVHAGGEELSTVPLGGGGVHAELGKRRNQTISPPTSQVC